MAYLAPFLWHPAPRSRRPQWCASLTVFALLGCTADPAGTSDGDETTGEDASTSGTDTGTATATETGETGNTETGDGIAILDVNILQPEDCGLSAIIEVETSEASAVEVTTISKDGLNMAAPQSTGGTSHRIILAGLHASQNYDITITATSNDTGESVSETSPITTGPLPVDTEVADPPVAAGEVDLTSFGALFHGPVVRQDTDPLNVADTTVALARDGNGEVNWWFRDLDVSESFVARDVDKLDDGRIMLRIPGQVRLMNAACESLGVYNSPIEGWGIHHDARVLPNGNILALARETQSIDVPALGGVVSLQGDTLIELNPDGEAIWTWSSFDHLDTQRFPGSLSMNQKMSGSGPYHDWTHGNGVWYDASDDSILVSLRHQNWVIKVDHSTGDVLWTLGDGGDFTLAGANAEWFYSQHNPSLTTDDTILLYDNGNERPNDPGSYSRAVRLELDTATMTATQVWSYEVPAYTPFLGGASELESGNILVTAGGQRTNGVPAYIIEVDPDANNDVMWQMEYAESLVYRANRHSSIAGESFGP